MPANVDTADIIRAALNANRANLHTCLPGKVLVFDSITTTVTVQPVIKNPVFDVETGEPESGEDLPIIPNVPVVFPRGGGFHMSFPLMPGDHVVLVFSELATAQWRLSGGVSEAVDVRRHSLAYPFAIPGAFPMMQPLLSQNPITAPLIAGKAAMGIDGDPISNIRVGPGTVECGGAAPLPVAMAAGVVTALTAINTWAAALQTALSAPAATVATVAAAMATPTATLAAAITAAGVSVPAIVTKGQ